MGYINLSKSYRIVSDLKSVYMLANNADHLNVDESQLITSMDFGETQLMSCILGKESYAQLKVFQIYEGRSICNENSPVYPKVLYFHTS